MRNGGKVFFYGGASTEVLDLIMSLLPFNPASWITAFEHFGKGLKIDWDGGKTGARRRNYLAAMLCNALVIIGRPRFTASVVKAFRQRGRRIFWFNPKTSRLTEVEIGDNILMGLSALPKEATWEPTLWEEQRKVRDSAIQEYLDAHPEKQRTADSIPTFGWMEVFNEDEIESSPDDIFKRCRRSKLSEATL